MIVYSFECDRCGFWFETDSEALDRPDKDSGEDLCCPVCRGNHFLIHPRVVEDNS